MEIEVTFSHRVSLGYLQAEQDQSAEEKTCEPQLYLWEGELSELRLSDMIAKPAIQPCKQLLLMIYELVSFIIKIIGAKKK